MTFTKLSVILELLLSCVISDVTHASGTIHDVIRLREYLFSNYSREIRPVYNVSDALIVDTKFFLLSILDVDEVSGTVVVSGGLLLSWIDFRLTWSPSDYGGIDNIMVNASKIWKPSIFLISSAADLDSFGSDQCDARILSTGAIYVSPGKLIKSSCMVDMTNFPTDSQRCSLILSSWGYMDTEIKLSYTQTDFIMNYFNPNGEWHVDKTLVEDYLLYGPGVSVISYTMFLTRRSAYFVISMIMPAYILCFLNPFVFLLPASSGERVSYIITMFLSLAVYMTIIGDSMPKVSEPMAGISYFLLISMIYSCVLIILTIFTLRCEAVTDVSQFPKWLIRLVSKLTKKKANTKINIVTPVNVDGFQKSDNTLSPKCRDKDELELEKTLQDHNDVTETIDIDKRDVNNFIDLSLFYFNMLIIVSMIIGFTLHYYK